MRGEIVGGDANCKHKFEPIVTSTSPTPPVEKQKIVYPTDAELKWLRIIDQNKSENATHLTKFKSDLQTLGVPEGSSTASVTV